MKTLSWNERTARDLLRKLSHVSASIRISVESADEAFTLLMTGAMGIFKDDDFGVAVSESNALAISLRDAIFEKVSPADGSLEIRLRDSSRCFLGEVPTAAAIH